MRMVFTLPQDEGPAMVAEGQEITDDLRTKVRVQSWQQPMCRSQLACWTTCQQLVALATRHRCVANVLHTLTHDIAFHR